MTHIKGNKILISKEEIASILIPFDNGKPTLILEDENGLSKCYTIDLQQSYIFGERQTNSILVQKIK